MNTLGDKNINIFGFKFKLKNFLLTVIIALFVLLVLILLDTFKVMDVSWYGVIIGTGFLIALVMATQLCESRGLNRDFPYDLILWVFPLSLVGARIYYVLCSLDEFSNFWEMCAIWNGGMAIYGGIIGGLIGLVICCLIHKKDIVATMDVVAPCLIFAQAIGRWGNFVNQEVYGFEVTNKALQWFPICVHITKNGMDSWHLATFFYESFLNVLGCIGLVILLRKVKLKGIVASSYLIFYGIVRFFLEGLRVEGYILFIPGTHFPVSQAVSLAIIVIGVAWLCYILIKNGRKIKNEKNNDLQNTSSN